MFAKAFLVDFFFESASVTVKTEQVQSIQETPKSLLLCWL